MPPDLDAVSLHRHARMFNNSLITSVASTVSATSSLQETDSSTKDTTTHLRSSTISPSSIFVSTSSSRLSAPGSSPSATRITSSVLPSSSPRFTSSSSPTSAKTVSTSSSRTVTPAGHRPGLSPPITETEKKTSSRCSSSLPCDSTSSEHPQASSTPKSIVTLSPYPSQTLNLTIPFATLHTYTSAYMPSSYHSNGTTHPTSSILPSSSGVLSTNSPDDQTSFSRNTGAILGVAIASAAFLLALAVLLFCMCRRFRQRRLKDIASANSSRYLTTALGRSGSLRSPIDGDDTGLFSGPYGDILSVMQLPEATPADMTQAPHNDEASRSQESGTSSHNRSRTAPPMEQNDQRTPVAFPQIASVPWHAGTGTMVSPQLWPGDNFIPYPDETTKEPAYTTVSPISSLSSNGIKPDQLASSYYATPRHSLLNPPPPVHNNNANADLIITIDRPVNSVLVPWLHRPASGSSHLRGETSSSSPSARSRDDSPTRVPDGLLHPLLAQRTLHQPGSARTFLDNVDYSRPISGVHKRVDSITTFSTQGTAEADLGHEPDAR